jgi:hypothetical protein
MQFGHLILPPDGRPLIRLEKQMCVVDPAFLLVSLEDLQVRGHSDANEASRGSSERREQLAFERHVTPRHFVVVGTEEGIGAGLTQMDCEAGQL